MPTLLQLIDRGRHKIITTITQSFGAASADKVPSTNAQGVLDPSITNASATSAASKLAMMNAQGFLDPTILNASQTPAANGIAQYDGSGRLPESAMPSSYGKDVNLIVCSENLSAGDVVNFHTVSGASRCRKADATSGTEREVRGYVKQSYTSGQTAEVFADGTNTGASGLTPGNTVFLDVTAGKVTTTEPAAPAMLQVVGSAVNATSYDYAPETPVVRS